MHIDKVATDNLNNRRPCRFFKNARSAFRAFLESARCACDDVVLLPAYVGWSAREGSGVFDPVEGLGLSCRFYRMDERLNIDLEHLRHLFLTNRVKVFVIIHYFGYVDSGYEEAVAIAREHGAVVLEDEAHAMFTDLVGGVAGRLGDAAIFSLHKLLPVSGGGMLMVNRGKLPPGAPQHEVESAVSPLNFDMNAIARKRVANAERLTALLAPHADDVQPLRTSLRPGEVPQSYPVLIRRVSRDQLYHRMNEAGYGVVSLYHTMIGPISSDDFPQSHAVARRILNLPLHQDVEPSQLVAMTGELAASIRSLS